MFRKILLSSILFTFIISCSKDEKRKVLNNEGEMVLKKMTINNAGSTRINTYEYDSDVKPQTSYNHTNGILTEIAGYSYQGDSVILKHFDINNTYYLLEEIFPLNTTDYKHSWEYQNSSGDSRSTIYRNNLSCTCNKM